MQRKDLFRFYISLALALIGLFAIFSPQFAMFAVVIILGIILLLWGLVTVIRFYNRRQHGSSLFDDGPQQSVPALRITIAILLFIAGILLLVFSVPAKDTFIPVVIGFWALVAGVFCVINAIKSYRHRQEYLLSIIALAVSFATAIAFFVLSSAGFTSPAGGVFLLIFGLITSIEISITSRTTSY
ncbi:MAG: DUF308 domain-containing protein [Eubacteriales bacterium]